MASKLSHAQDWLVRTIGNMDDKLIARCMLALQNEATKLESEAKGNDAYQVRVLARIIGDVRSAQAEE